MIGRGTEWPVMSCVSRCFTNSHLNLDLSFYDDFNLFSCQKTPLRRCRMRNHYIKPQSETSIMRPSCYIR